jgi:RimJ/RimL family protein N-acetyltransferase
MMFADAYETAAFVAEANGIEGIPWKDWTHVGIKDENGMAGGIIFTGYTGNDIEVHIAIRPKSRGAIVFRYGLMYVFDQLLCRHISATIESDNLKSRRICERLGFVQEGIKRQAGRDGQDCYLYGLLKHEITKSAGYSRLRNAS